MSFTERLHNLHRRLSRYDVDKDIATVSPFFTERANALFGPLQDTDLQSLRNEITDLMQTKRSVLPCIQKEGRREWHVPEFVKIAIQDSGIAPIHFNPRLRQYLVTPGTYMDTAPKTKKNDLITYVHFGFHTIPDSLFQAVQVPIHSFVASLTTNKECTIQFVYKQRRVTCTFDAAHKPTGPLKSLFLGNTQKDEWFQGQPSDATLSELYILCKELGDMMQIVYGRLFMQQADPDSVCVFTCDKPASLRAQLLGIPSILVNENKKAQYMEDTYTFTQSSVDSAMKHFHFQHMNQNNTWVVSTINKVLLAGYYRNRSQSQVPLQEVTRRKLKQIIQLIMEKTDQAMREIHTPKCQTMDLETFRQYVYTFQALPLFDADQLVPFSVGRLFVRYRNVQRESEDARIVASLWSMQGGSSSSSSSSSHVVYNRNWADFTKLDSETQYSPNTLLQHGIFTCLKDRLSSTTDELCYLTGDIFIVLSVLFDFTGGVCYNPTFLGPLVDQFLKTGLAGLDYVSFEQQFESWKAANVEEYEQRDLLSLDGYFGGHSRKTWKRRNIDSSVKMRRSAI